MRIIGQGMYFQQQRPKNWGQLPIGATLGDELGGVGYIGADGSNSLDGKFALPLLTGDGSGVPTSVSSAPESSKKEEVLSSDDNTIFGMTKKQFATGIIVGVLGGLALYYGYKHFNKKVTV